MRQVELVPDAARPVRKFGSNRVTIEHMTTYKYTQPTLPRELPAQAPPIILETAASLEHAEITRASWAGQTAKRLSVDSVRLTEPDLTAAQLHDGGWVDVEIAGGQLGGLNLSGSSWRRVRVSRARLSGAVFTESELKDVTFEDAKLDMANFRYAKLKNVQFIRCQLAEAGFAGAHLTDVTFAECDLTSAEFSGAVNKHVDLRGNTLLSINGIAGLAHATISTEQMIGLMPELAANLGLDVKDD